MNFPAAFSSCRTGLQPASTSALARLGMASLMIVCQAHAESRGADGASAAARPRIVDPAIQPAGGVSCTTCGPGGCRPLHGGHHHGHHAGCRDGVCVPVCPVRPQQFGFYGTQWRRWPGRAIVPVSAEQDAAPVSPPRSAVPGAGEESLAPQGESEAAGDTGTRSDSAPTPLVPSRQPLPEPARPEPTLEPGRLEPAPESRPEAKSESRIEPKPQPEPAREPPLESATPRAEPPTRPTNETAPGAREPAQQAPETKPRPEDENLFEVLSGWRARRTFPVGTAGGSTAAAAGQAGTRRVGHAEESAPRPVPRVPFDPAAETRRLRSAR
jgi:hypothetical protein